MLLVWGMVAVWEMLTKTSREHKKIRCTYWMSGSRLMAIMFHQNPVSSVLRSAVCQMIQIEQIVISCGKKIMKKDVLLMVKVLAVRISPFGARIKCL